METCYKLLIWSIRTESEDCISSLTDTVTQYSSTQDSRYNSQGCWVYALYILFKIRVGVQETKEEKSKKKPLIIFSLFDFPIIVDAEEALCLIKSLIISYFLREEGSERGQPNSRGEEMLSIKNFNVYKVMSY